MLRSDALVAGFSGALGVAVLALILFVAYRFGEAMLAVSTPFVAGAVIALLLNPLVVRVQRGVRVLRNRRDRAVFLVYGLFLLSFVALVTLLVPSLIGQSQALLRWFAPSTYTLARATTPDGPYTVLARRVPGTNYTVRGLENGTTYYFRVEVVNDDGQATPITKEPVVAVAGEHDTPAGTLSPSSPPPPDSGTVLAQPGDTTVVLRWSAPPEARSGFDQLRTTADKWLSGHQKLGPFKLPPSLEAITTQYSDQLSQGLRVSATRVLEVIVGSVSGLLAVIVIPIVTFYLLQDLSRLRARLLFLLPERVRGAFVSTSTDIGEVFGNYLRGMVQVCLMYSVVAMIGMFGVGLFFRPMLGYALLIGAVAGVLYSVPYVGFLGTALLTSTVVLASGSGIGALIASIVTLFVLNQTFDNVIMPRVVGGGVGLHPLLSLFALLLGANLFGLWGMLLAVPAAGSIQTILFRLFPRLAAPTSLGAAVAAAEASAVSEATTDAAAATLKA
jgi:predicted PurR-regulated permease PerM